MNLLAAKLFPRPSLPRAVPRYHLRQATLADVDVLVRHRRRMWAAILEIPENELDHADRVYRRWLRSRLRNGRVVGFIEVTPIGFVAASGCVWIMPSQPRPMWRGTQVPYLMSMFTEPEHRGRGLATQIVRAAIRWSKSRGFDHLNLHASEFGKPTYTRMGFSRTREMRIDLGEPRHTRSSTKSPPPRRRRSSPVRRERRRPRARKA
jgi:GNAT superfamily N-acetyltransferase